MDSDKEGSLLENSLAVQWLGLSAFTAEDLGSIPGWGTKIPQAVQCGQKEKKVSLTFPELSVFLH